MKYTQWRTWQASWSHIAGGSTAVSAWPNAPSVNEKASERVSMKPATHGEWFELHGWIQNQCCELSSMPVNHLKCTCSVVDKGIFQSMLKKIQKIPTRNCHTWPFWLAVWLERDVRSWDSKSDCVLKRFLTTREENTKPVSPVWDMTPSFSSKF